MNFKGWEKIQEDAHKVMLKHPHGHTMTIAVKSLPKILQEQIKHLKFAEGGKIEEDEEELGVSEQGRDVRMAHKMKKRGDPEHKMHEEFAKDEAKGRAEAERKMVKPKMKGLARGGKVQHYFDGADPVEGQPDDSAPDAGADQSSEEQAPTRAGSVAPITINVGAPAQAAVPQAVRPMAVAPSQSPPTPAVPPPIPAIPPANGSTMQNEARKSLQGVDIGEQGAGLQAGVQAAQARATAPAEAEAIKSEQEIAAQNARAYNEIMQHTQDFNDYVNKNPINPRHYMESLSSGQKTAAAIGLALGGFGTAFGGHNFAFDALQKQIDRDLDAQKQNVHNQQTVLGAWQHLYGDNNISTNLAKASLNDILAKKIQLAAAQTGSAQAQANALLNIQKLRSESDALRMQAATMAGYSRATGAPPPGTPARTQKAPGQPSEPQAKEESGVVHILKPDVYARLNRLAFHPIAKNDLSNIQDQVEKARQVEKVLNGPKGNGVGGIDDVIQGMYRNLGGGTNRSGGFGTSMILNADKAMDALSEVPVVGALGAAGKGMINMAPMPDNVRDYQSNKTTMINDLGSALQGIVPPSEIKHMVEPNLPAFNDTPAQVKTKIERIKANIVKAMRQGRLERWGLSD